MKNALHTGYVIVRKSGHAMYSDKQVTNMPYGTQERAAARLSSYGADYYIAEVHYKTKGARITLVGHYNFQTI